MTGSNITHADTGLGTTFERWALNRALKQLQQTYGFERVLEGPGDGMTGIAGINSLILGLQGCEVTLALGDAERAAFARRVWQTHAPQAAFSTEETAGMPFPDQSFDLAWNFNILTRAADPQGLLAEMARVSRRYVFFCVPNAQNYAFWLHRLHHRVAKQAWDHGDVGLMRPAPWKALAGRMGLRVHEVLYLDCPWWPDIVDMGQLIADFFPLMKKAAQKAKPEQRMKWEAYALPYYQPERHPEVHRQMAKLAFFENSRAAWLKRLFGHHFGIFAERMK
ncbi:MAG: class I SAM-dependent methyltransferase [Chloroflexota bacterium]